VAQWFDRYWRWHA